MSDNECDRDFSGRDDAKAEIRAAVRYFSMVLQYRSRCRCVGSYGNMRQVGLPPPEQRNPLDDDMPGG